MMMSSSRSIDSSRVSLTLVTRSLVWLLSLSSRVVVVRKFGAIVTTVIVPLIPRGGFVSIGLPIATVVIALMAVGSFVPIRLPIPTVAILHSSIQVLLDRIIGSSMATSNGSGWFLGLGRWKCFAAIGTSLADFGWLWLSCQ